MQISPILSYRNINFKGNNDFRDLISNALKKASGPIENNTGDSFIPSNPSQPIVIEKLEIRTGENESKEGKGGDVLKTLGGGAAGAAGGAGIAKATGSEDKDNHSEKTENDEQKNDTKIDIDKIIDEKANENSENKNEESDNNQIENDEDNHHDIQEEDYPTDDDGYNDDDND